MKLGFGLPVSGSWASVEHVSQVARQAETLGYHSLWSYQRLLSPVDGAWGEMYRAVHDPTVTLAYVAALTSRIRLGVAVVNLPFVSPVLLAKQWTTLDTLCSGRLDAGLGNGWAPEEYAATGATTVGTARRADEFIGLLKLLWTEEVVEHQGEFYTVPRTRIRRGRGRAPPRCSRRSRRLTERLALRRGCRPRHDGAARCTTP